MARKKKVVGDEQKFVVVTQEMLDANPAMVADGVEVGDEIPENETAAPVSAEVVVGGYPKGKVATQYSHLIDGPGETYKVFSGSLPEGVVVEGKSLVGSPTPEACGLSKFKLMALAADGSELGEVIGEIAVEL